MKQATVAVIVFAVILFGIVFLGELRRDRDPGATLLAEQAKDRPRYLDYGEIDPANFVAIVDNPYFALTPGTSYTYKSKTENGDEKNIVIVTDKKRNILGISATVVWDRVWWNGELHEETYDWYAQDKSGNVVYLGEDSRVYQNDIVISTEGSWEAGQGGAKAGIIMKADPKPGDFYMQENHPDKAEDIADIEAVVETVTVPYGTFTNCLRTRDRSRIDPGLNELKYYCPEVGGFTLEIDADSGERTELVEVSRS